MKSSFDGILFDLGNVLVHIDADAVWKGIPPADRLRLGPPIRAAVMAYEHGRITTGEFLTSLQETLEGRFTREELLQAFMAIIRDPVQNMEEIVRRVAATCRTAMVSNTSQAHFDYSMQSVPALRLLHDHFVSFRIGAMKPAAEFYRHVIDRMGIEPSRLLFIDDLQQNVDGAERTGMKGHRFTSAENLERDLERLGILERRGGDDARVGNARR